MFIILSLFLYLVTGHLPTEHKSDLGHIGKGYKGRKDHNKVSVNRIFRLIGRYKKTVIGIVKTAQGAVTKESREYWLFCNISSNQNYP
jgi:hypothetical protein